MKEFLTKTAHRPFPVPDRNWIMAMRWHDLFFAHWPVPPEKVRPLIPSSLELDTFEGQAWIGIVPFWMSGVRLRYQPESLSFAFLELNVRTYVKTSKRPGVWFFSLDAANRLAVRAARWWYSLPYYDAHMSLKPGNANGSIHYESKRVHEGDGRALLDIEYAPTGNIYHAEPGTLDHWLTERYGLYAVDQKGKARFGHIHHRPWNLQRAEADIFSNTMTIPLGIELPNIEPVLHFSKEQHMVAWTLSPVAENPK